MTKLLAIVAIVMLTACGGTSESSDTENVLGERRGTHKADPDKNGAWAI